ncbi:MAG: hypothetical protein DRR16_33505, partial [Candidatus Parabeggiatoa sp. nov. 3]
MMTDVSTEAQINRYFTAKGNPGRKPRTTFSRFHAKVSRSETLFHLRSCAQLLREPKASEAKCEIKFLFASTF